MRDFSQRGRQAPTTKGSTMTEYALAPSRKWTPESGFDTPSAMLEHGLLNAYRVRENGTMRHVELYPLGSTVREAAEWVSDRVDMDGASVQAVARELWVSTPTIRRYLEGLELTEDIETGDWDDLRFAPDGSPIFNAYSTEENTDLDAIMDLDGPAAALKVEGGTDPTLPVTRDAVPCNCAMRIKSGTCEHTESPRTRRTRRPVTPEAQSAKDAELLARNQARFAPKTEPATDVPGSQCEPVGTPADEVEAALAASVAQAAPRTDGLPMCFCGDQGVHAPGAQGCKHVAIPRRTRSHG